MTETDGMEKQGAGPLIAGVEAGGSKIVVGLARMDRAGGAPVPLERAVVPTGTPGTSLPAAREALTALTARYGGPAAIAAVGIASFGPVILDRTRADFGRIGRTPKPHWQGTDIYGAFSMLAPEATALDTDVAGAALAEHFWGASSVMTGSGITGSGDEGRGGLTAYVTVGTGIGAGVAGDAGPLKGAGHYEMGHIPVTRDRRDGRRDPYLGLCPFHRDCLEGMACGPAILDRWGMPLSDLPAGHDGADLIAHYLGQLAVTLVYVHAPERLVFGGGVMKTPGLIARVRGETAARLAGYPAGGPLIGPDANWAGPEADWTGPGANNLAGYIVAPALGDDAGLIGAFALGAFALGAFALGAA